MEKFSLLSLNSGTAAEKNIGNSSEINIINMSKSFTQTVSHDSKKLLEIIKKKRQKVSSLYENEYNSCWERIYDANNCNLKYIMYTVPKFNIECDLYNPLICM